ncbi:hypothetical protein SAMN05216215_1018110 [Saccharopolyspora shandongensis]|uniref:Excreted virulence factor EspC, type VII ESX diderm n=1 Tax=Saccharopolyspora shandongensis TaxID=418495 RepID=A0A1H3GAZ0_9PSEU|nr:hypothetical protein [Saccharopolyspora shandongensis]SDY00441.1 hypothetical protein SAMN05216215_1018110 [Saccharopolyspora shandongensis]
MSPAVLEVLTWGYNRTTPPPADLAINVRWIRSPQVFLTLKHKRHHGLRHSRERSSINPISLGRVISVRDGLQTIRERSCLVDGFRVDLTALTGASKGVRDTIESMNDRKVSDVDCPADAFGHDRLATTVDEFCNRWNEGVTNLTDDAKEVSARLDYCAKAYLQTDEAARAHFEGIVQRTGGDDPAAQ